MEVKTYCLISIIRDNFHKNQVKNNELVRL